MYNLSDLSSSQQKRPIRFIPPPYLINPEKYNTHTHARLYILFLLRNAGTSTTLVTYPRPNKKDPSGSFPPYLINPEKCNTFLNQNRKYDPALNKKRYINYLVEARATTAHVSTISADNSKSCWPPVASYERKHVKAVPSRPVYTVGSIPIPIPIPIPCCPLHVTCTT